MNRTLLLSFITASFLLTLMPGPDNMLVLTESLSAGQKKGFALAMGMASGIFIHTIAAATGLSFIIQKSILIFSIIKYAGAAYLIYMAIYAIKEKNPTDITSVIDNKTSFFNLYKKGAIMNVLNPKVSIFFIAFFPQFITPNGIHISLQMIIMGFIFVGNVIVVFGSIALLAGKFNKLLSRSKFFTATKWTKVTLLSVLGIGLALSKK